MAQQNENLRPFSRKYDITNRKLGCGINAVVYEGTFENALLCAVKVELYYKIVLFINYQV